MGSYFEDFLLDEADSNIQANLEDEVVQEALRSGVDLREYSKQVEDELKVVENKSIEEYIREGQNIASLHNQIVDCDQILERMENMLLSFQSDLGSISSEILALQQQSVEMNMKLKNRQAVKGELSQFVKDLTISEKTIRTINDVPVTEQEFLNELLLLEQKITFLKEQSFRESKSCFDVRDVVEKLKIKAVSKIREFMLEKINSFKKPLSNYHIQQNALIKFKFYFKFLVANNREVAKEVRGEYVDTMSKVMFSYFKSYSGRLIKLQFDQVATKEDLMGTDDTVVPRITSFFSKSSIKNKASVFTMGDRGKVLNDLLEAPPIVPHAQQSVKYSYEVLFRAEQYAFMENACREYAFCVEFFMAAPNDALELFQFIMGKTSALLIKNIDHNISESYDGIALYLCWQLVLKFAKICHERGVSALDKHWDAVEALCKKRLLTVLELNIQSIKEVDSSKMRSVDERPHYITRRYAEFIAGILGLNEPLNDESVSRHFSAMQVKVEHFIQKMASIAFREQRSQLIFQINNYDVIITIISERSHSESKELESFKNSLSTVTSQFVEQALQTHFGELISFVLRAEPYAQTNLDKNTVSLKNQSSAASATIRNFNSNWKRSLDQLNVEVINSFQNLKLGTNILQQTLTQFVQYYHRFHKIMNHAAFSAHPDKPQLINIHQLMVEVKKYKPSF